MKVTKNFKRMAKLYKIFAPSYSGITFTKEDMLQAYILETYGIKSTDPGLFKPETNGYILGKKYMNLAVSEWKDAIHKGMLLRVELYEDPVFYEYHWWLDSIFNENDAHYERLHQTKFYRMVGTQRILNKIKGEKYD